MQPRFTEQIQSRGLTVEQLWDQPCSAYNVQFLLPTNLADTLVDVQSKFAAWDSGLLRVPASAMHISLLWLLSVRVDYGGMKDQLWLAHRDEWLAAIAQVAGQTSSIALSFTGVAVTESSIIALASPPDEVNRLRRRLEDALDLPAETRNTADLVHCTLFRYASGDLRYRDLIATAHGVQLDLPFRIDHVAVTRELRFPSLHSEVVASYDLAGEPTTYR